MKASHWLGISAGALCMAAAIFTGTSSAEAQDHRGGTMRLVAVSAGGTIDPQVNYTLQYWQLYQGIYDGLLNFKKGTGEEGFKVVPDLAEDMPQVADDGKTLVFKLRKGIKFSNGQEVTVKDVVASFQRIFKISSPTAGGFYSGIVGADKCLAEPATCTLDGGVVADEAANTVTIHLTQPDAEIYYKLAVPHAVILPASSPTKDDGTILPGTGAYMIESYDPNKQLKIVRNPHFKEWSKDAQPDGYPDVVVMDFGLTDDSEITAVANGQADWAFDPPPPDRLAEIGTKYKDQVYVNTLTAMWYAPMNVNIPPFNNEKARQAVSYALDRNALVKRFGGKVLAQPVCQILPPGFPGHEPYCPYTKNPGGGKYNGPDMDMAKKLMEESGQKGQPVTVISEDSAVSKSVGTYIQSVLNELGFKAELKPISSNIQFTYIQNTNNKVQISVTQWYQDYPAASDFLNILFGCDSFHEGSDSSINIAGFCDKEIDAKMKEALKVAVTDQKKADDMWKEIDKAVTDKAAAATLFTPKHVDFVSKRLGNFQFNPQYYFMVYQAWVQ